MQGIITILIYTVVALFIGSATYNGIFDTIKSSQTPTSQPELKSEVFERSLTPTLTLAPTPTIAPKVSVKTKPISNDPIVDCVANGETYKVRKSFCDSLIDCHLPTPDGGIKIVRITKDKCDEGLLKIEEAKRTREQRQKQQEGMVNCKLSSGDFGIIKKEQCQQLFNEQVKKEEQQKLQKLSDIERRMWDILAREDDIINKMYQATTTEEYNRLNDELYRVRGEKSALEEELKQLQSP